MHGVDDVIKNIQYVAYYFKKNQVIFLKLYECSHLLLNKYGSCVN